MWTLESSCGFETDKIKFLTIPYTGVGRGLDLGCGPKRIWPSAIGVDQYLSERGAGIVGDITDLSLFADQSMPWVFSSHALEDHEASRNVAILKEWCRVIKTGGCLVLYLPDEDEYPRVGQPGANPAHQQNLNRNIVVAAMREAVPDGWDLCENEVRSGGNEYSFYQSFRLTRDGEFRESWLRTRPAKTACVVRYGGTGDQIMAANVFPALKRAGFHLTVMTTPQGKQVIEHDPHVDAWIIQDSGQVPNEDLPGLWMAWQSKFDRFVNLSESVEGTLLAIPGRANHAWPDAVRRKRLNVNYGEWTAELAEVPYASEARFYPTADEEKQADEYIASLRGDIPFGTVAPPVFTVLWVLAGSSIHKFYPHMDTLIARMLVTMPEVRITFVGDAACEILELGWEKEPRIKRLSGKLSIRQSLVLAQKMDMVIGPETGVLNAVAFEANAKVVFMSHSSANMLTKHWVNTTSLVAPEDSMVSCRNLFCCQMHYSRDFCPEHKPTGAAMCQASITPDQAYAAVKAHYSAWKAKYEPLRHQKVA